MMFVLLKRLILCYNKKPYIMIRIKTKIQMSSSKRSYEVYYSYDNGTSYHLHKTGLTLDEANRESISIKGTIKLLRDLKVK